MGARIGWLLAVGLFREQVYSLFDFFGFMMAFKANSLSSSRIRRQRKRDCVARRGRFSLGRLLSLEQFEPRMLLAADVIIGFVDDTVSYSRVVSGNVATYTPLSSPAEIGITNFTADFAQNFDIVVNTQNAGFSDPGDITFSDFLFNNVPGIHSLTLQADRDINVEASVSSLGLGVGTTLIFNADRDANGDGRVAIIGVSNSIDAGAGNIVIGGGLDPLLTPAVGRAGAPQGVIIDATLQATDTGSVSIRGQGGGTTDDNATGVLLVGSISTLDGAISVQGTAGVTTGLDSDGVRLEPASFVTTDRGAVEITGTANGSTRDNDGVFIGSGAEISSTATSGVVGAITINGTSNSSTGEASTGVYLDGGTINVGNAAVSLIGRTTTTGTGAGNNGVLLVGGQIESSGTPLSGVVGDISIDGQSDSSNESTQAVLLTGTSLLESADAAIRIIGDASGPLLTGQGEGVTIGDGSTVATDNSPNLIFITGTGAGASGEGVLIFDNASIGSSVSPVSLAGIGNGSHGIVVDANVQAGNLQMGGVARATTGGAGVIVASNGNVSSTTFIIIGGQSFAATSFGIDLFEGSVSAINSISFTSSVGPLRLVRAQVTAGLGIDFETIDRAGGDDTIDVFESTINANTSDISFTAGDSVVIDSTSSITGNNLTINVDRFNDADPGLGGFVDAQGTYTLSGNASVFGGADADFFRPVSGIVSSIDGGGQPIGTTDLVEVSGGAESVTVLPNSVITSNETVILNNIELVAIITTSSIDITGSPAADLFTLSRSGVNTRVNRSGAPAVVFNSTDVNSLNIDGDLGNDTFELDVTGGLPTGLINFEGNLPTASPGDQILITGTPPTPIDTLRFASVGRFEVFAGGLSTNINYSGVEAITSSIDVQNTFFDLINDNVIDVTQTAGDLTAAFSAGTATTFRQPTAELGFLAFNNFPPAQTTINFAAIDVAIPTLAILLGFNLPNSTVNINGLLRNSNGGLAISQANVNINAAIDITGSLSIDDGTGTGLTTVNAASIATGGLQTYFSPIQIDSDATITSPAGFNFQSTIDGANRLTVDGGASFRGAVGATTPLASLTVVGNAAIERSITSTGNQAYNGPVTIELPNAVITSQLGSLAFNSSLDSGGGGFFDFTTNSSLTSTFTGPVGVSRPITSLTTVAGGPFVVPATLAVSSYSVTVTDTAGATDNISIVAGTTINAPGGVTLTAGDDVNIAAGASITTSLLNINADTDPSDPDTIGANVSVLGTINATAGSSVTSIATGDNADTLAVRPQSTTSFDLRAGGPSLAPGDTLTIDGGGGGDVTFDVASGAINVPGALPILAVGFENLSLTNIGTLSVDGSDTFDLITVAGGAVLGTDLLSVNGNSPISLVGVTNLVINGLGGDDFFGYDVRTRAISAAVTFNGGLQDNTTGGDILRVDGSFTTQVLNYSAPGAEGNNGDLVLDGALVTYTGLEPIVAGNSVDTVLNFNTGASNNATLRNNPSAGLIEIVDNGATFEDTQFPNPSRGLAINLGSQGDTLSVVALDPAFRAGLAIRGGIGADTVTIDGLTISNTTGGTGALQIEDIEALDIANSIFNNNNATAIQLDNPGGVATIATTTIIGNTSPSSGGGIFLNQGDLQISNSTISSNVATVAGGGISIGGLGGAVEISDTIIEGNSADDVGGGIARIGSTASTILTNVMLEGNVATANAGRGHGGGLYFDGLTNTQVLGGRIFNNIANAEGGGIWQDFGVLTISGMARIDGNFANGDLDPAGAPDTLQGGGGIFNNGGTLLIDDVGGAVEVSGNFATGFSFGSGGGILSIGGSVTITGALINQNLTVRAGGGLEIVEGNVTLINSTIDANRVATQSPITANPGNGGGLHITGGASVTIDGGSVTNNVAEEEGGGLWNSATGTLRIIGLTSPVLITGNIARGDAAPGVDGSAVQGGGGVFNNGGTLVLDGDRVSKNIDVSGNAATGATNGSGGGILSIGGNVAINGAAVSGNEAVRAGGGIEVVAGALTILQTNITGNDVSSANLLNLGLLDGSLGNGGGLHITGAATVVFDGGTVSGNVAALEGGGFWNSATGILRIEDSQDNTVISDNIAQGNVDPAGAPATLQGGGGVFNNGGTLEFNDLSVNRTITVSANAASGANFGSGGGILSIAGNVTLTAVEINGNEAVRAGGGVEIVNGTFTMVGGQITGNDVSEADLLNLGLLASPGNGGGLHVTGNANVAVTGVSITSNVAGREGGGLWNSTGTMIIQGGTLIEDNIASGDAADDGGGGVFNNGGTLMIIGTTTTIANNVANGTLGSGGGIFNSTGGTVSITDAIISDNKANRAGGGIEDASGAGFGVSILRAQLIDNLAGVLPAIAAPGNGGGLHVTGDGNVTMDSAIIQGNIAAAEGGGLWNDLGTMTILGTTIINANFARGVAADDGGGGIFNNGGSLVVSGPSVSITNNQASGASGSGGGIFNRNSGSITISDALITSNSASLNGGGLFADGSGTIIIDRTTFSANSTLTGTGGGIGLINTNAPGSATLRSTTIHNNTAATSGGGIALRNFNFTMENVTISTNTAGTVGGGIDYGNVATSGQRLISFSTITSNIAASGGSNLNATGSRIDAIGTLFNDGTIDAAGVLSSLGNNLDSGNTSGFNQPTDFVNTNPLLGPLQDNGGPVFTHALEFGSPAIDAGGTSGPATDARGITRPNDGDGDGIARFDIGAAEGEQGTTFVVDNLSDIDDGDVTPGNLSLREAVRLSNTAPGADTITFGGLFTDATPDTISLAGSQLRLTDNVTIIGSGAALLTIDANNASRIFEIDTATTVTLSRMTFTGGRVTEDNGGAVRSSGNLTIIDSVITGNTAISVASSGYGGGIDSSGQLTIIRSTLSSNSATNDGGAISASNDLIITDSSISGNTASSFGAGLAFFPSSASNTATILRSTIANNTAGDSGGGIFNAGAAGTLSVVESTISGNTSGGIAGGIFSYSNGNLNLVNSTVSGNVGGGGSGLTIGYSSSDTATITNSTIVGNSGGDYGVYIGDAARVVITNSIIAGNTVDASATTSDLNNTVDSGSLDLANSFANLIGNPNTAGGLIHGTNGNILGNGSGAVLPLASILNPSLVNNGGPTLTHALIFGSPAIDAANAGLAPATDQRGIARPVDGNNDGSTVADIGSFEFGFVAVLSVVDITVNEAIGTATVTVTLDRAVTGGFTVDFVTSNGTALQPGDYTTATGMLTFTGTAGELRTFTIPIIDDAIVEGFETILISLSNSSNVAVDGSDTAIVTTTDNDVAALSVADVTVNEGAGTATVTVSVNNAVQGGFTVNFATANGTASQPGDYTTATGTLTFTGTVGESRTFTVSIVDDTVVENTETVLIVLSNPSVANVNASDTATINIVDNDVSAAADLSVNISGAPSTVFVNEAVTYTVVVSNAGPDSASNAFSTTTLPSGVTITNVSATGATASTNGNVVTANIGSLSSGASITIVITAIAGSTTGSLVVTTTATSSNDPVATNNSDTATTVVNPPLPTDLSLSAASSPPIFSGASGFLDFEINNLSAVDATNVVAFFTLDPNVTFESGIVFPGTVTSLPGSNQVRVEIPRIDANQSVFVSINVFARNNLPGGMTLTTSGTVSAEQTDSDSVNNTISASTTVVSARTLSTGAQDGGVVLTVDLFGSMGSGSIGGISLFNPPGALDAAETIFEAGLLIGRNLGGTREVLTNGSFLSGGEIDPTLVTTIADLDGTDSRVTSSFMIGSLRFDLVQELLPVFDASGVATGSTLTQTYTVTNTATTATSFDLVRFVHADLLFDGNLEDGGGVLRTANGGIVLFETESSTLPGSDTTFVGISTDGGTIETNNQFQIASFDDLGNQVVAGTPLTGIVTGDLDGNGLIDPGQEYDVSLALRNLFQLAAGASTTYSTKTFFGSGTLESVSNPPSSIRGHVFCDANGSGIEETGEAESDVTVFIDLNGNRVLDSNELSTLTTASGDFFFNNVPSGAVTVAVVVPDGCNTIPRNVGVARTSLDAGKLARSIATVDLDGDSDMDLVVASDLSNNVTIFENNGGVFSIRETVTLSDRPQAISAWSPSSGSSESVIAVAGFGTPSNKGTVFKLSGGNTESFKSGDGPIALVVDDFNGDSIADIVSVASRSSDLSLTLGRASTSSSASTIGTSRILTGVRNIRAIITGDFNGDGNTDIAAAGLGFTTDANSELKVLLGRGDGTFGAAIARFGDREIVDLIASDLDGDGNDELLTLSATGQLKTYRLSALTLSQIAQTTVSVGASSFAVGDFNGDGTTDVAVANLGDEIIELLVGNRTGQFFVKSTVTNVTAPSDIVVADFDGDGKAEIAVANFYKQLPEVVTDQTPRNKLPSTLTILKLNIAEQAVMVNSESTSTVNVTFPSANPATLLDVNRDSFVSAVDALEIISAMRQNDLARLGNAEAEQSTAHKTGKVTFRAPQRVAADVNGDGRTSALDALMVINYLNQQQLDQLLAASGAASPEQTFAYDSLKVNQEDEDQKRVAAIDALFAGGLF